MSRKRTYAFLNVLFSVTLLSLPTQGAQLALPEVHPIFVPSLQGTWVGDAKEDGLETHISFSLGNDGTFSKKVYKIYENCSDKDRWTEKGTWSLDGDILSIFTTSVDDKDVNSSQDAYHQLFRIMWSPNYTEFYDLKKMVSWQLIQAFDNILIPCH